MMYPDDSIQTVISNWWEETESKELERGSLVYAFIPHVDQVPFTVIPAGRLEAECHDKASLKIEPLRMQERRPKDTLPVAAMTLHDGELWAAYRAKKRPCLVLGSTSPIVDKKLSRGMPKRSTAPVVQVAPYYGADCGVSRAGYNPELVDRIKHLEYQQFFWDKLPIGGPNESILRLDHMQLR